MSDKDSAVSASDARGNLAEAAVRHYRDASDLAGGKSYASAGYLIGFAVECAIKAHMNTPQSRLPRQHLPHLRDSALKLIKQRRGSPLHEVLKLQSFMEGWTTNLRYGPNSCVTDSLFSLWRGHAARVLGATGLLKGGT